MLMRRVQLIRHFVGLGHHLGAPAPRVRTPDGGDESKPPLCVLHVGLLVRRELWWEGPQIPSWGQRGGEGVSRLRCCGESKLQHKTFS